MTIISTTVGKNPLEEMSSHHSQQKSPKCSTWMQSQKQQNVYMAQRLIEAEKLLRGKSGEPGPDGGS